MYDIKTTACFTGHREEKLNIAADIVKTLLRKEIEKAISVGFNTYISGMAPGVDVWAAEIVLEMKEKNPDIRLVCALPFEGFDKKRSIEEKEQYYSIMERADKVEVICSHYSRSCFQLRNKWMVDNSSLVIAVYNGEKGGTRNTIKYAERCGKGNFQCVHLKIME